MGQSVSSRNASDARARQAQPFSGTRPTKPAAQRKALGEWDAPAVARAVAQRKLAPAAPGCDDPAPGKGAECPICFLYFAETNHARCCKQPICTPCYLQVRPPAGDVDCPFCSEPGFAAAPDEALSAAKPAPPAPEPPRDEAKGVAEERTTSIEERRRVEATIRQQLVEARERGDSAEIIRDPPPRPVARGNRSWARRPAPAGGFLRRRRPGDPPPPGLDDLRALLRTLGTAQDLQHVEDLMVLEAMQASMQDEERRRRAGSEGSADGPPAPAEAAAEEDDDDLAYRLAIRASLRDSEASAADAKESGGGEADAKPSDAKAEAKGGEQVEMSVAPPEAKDAVPPLRRDRDTDDEESS